MEHCAQQTIAKGVHIYLRPFLSHLKASIEQVSGDGDRLVKDAAQLCHAILLELNAYELVLELFLAGMVPSEKDSFFPLIDERLADDG